MDGAPGNFYQLCWAHDPEALESFLVEVDGAAEIAGPRTTALACTLGENCTVEIDGFAIASSSRAVFLSNGSCGDDDAVVANEPFEIANASGSGDNASFDFGMPLMGEPGNFYKVCFRMDLIPF